jgi:cytochrome c-type biogenesis protein CcmF
VENASLLPWLTGTAYIHSVMVQERRGMLRVWNLSLLIATFSLTILGTFLTRSGVVASVHSFSESAIGPYILGFFGVVVAVSLVLIAWRGDRLRSPGTIDSPLSREFGFLLNNLLFALFAFVVLLGTVYPLLVEALKDRRIVVGPPYFNALSMPIGMALLFLMAVAPVLPWRRASTTLLRERLFWPAWGGVLAMGVAAVVGAAGWVPYLAFGLGGFAAGAAIRTLALATRRQGWRGFVGRANGGMVVHLGVILIAVAFAASNSYTRTQEFDLNPGDSVSFAGHTFAYTDLQTFDVREKFGVKAIITVDGAFTLAPAATTYKGRGMAVPTPSVRSRFTEDIYLVIGDNIRPESFADPIQLEVSIKPMILWLWVGGLVVALGTLLSAFPGQRRRRGTEAVSAPVMTGASVPSVPSVPEAVVVGD